MSQPDQSQLISMSEVEKVHISKLLNAVNWNKMEDSGVLQITRPTLNKKIKKHCLLSQAPTENRLHREYKQFFLKTPL